MSGPSVTLGISCYKQATMVCALAESLLPSLGPGDELLIADDGSGDGQLAELRAFAAANASVRLIEGEPSGRAAFNRNRLLLEARGDFVLTVDGDDRLRSEWRDALEDALALDPAADVVFWDYGFVRDGQLTDQVASALRSRRLHTSLLSIAERSAADVHALAPVALQSLALRQSSPLHTVNCALRRSYLRRNHLWWDDRFRVAEDTDFFMRVLRSARTVFVDRPIGLYRLADGGLTRTPRLESDLARVVQRQALLLEAVRFGIDDEASLANMLARVSAAEADLAYGLRKHGFAALAAKFAGRSIALRPESIALKEWLKARLAAFGFVSRPSRSDEYWAPSPPSRTGTSHDG